MVSSAAGCGAGRCVPDPGITGNRSYTRAHFLFYAGVVTPGIYR